MKISYATKIKTAILAFILLGLLISSLTSCRTGYGCHGNQSWDRMVRRNNSAYVPNIKKHSKSEVDKAMSYSSSEYNSVMSASYMYQSLK